MAYTVYLRTNKINGKQYVGQTSNIKRRETYWKSPKCTYANKLLTEDRFKYGLENWVLEVIAEVDTREEAWKLEEKCIKEFNTRFPNGYNRAYGGKTNKGGNEGYHNGKEFKKGDEPWNKGVKNCFSDETIKKMSENHKGKHNSPSTEFKKGMKLSEGTKKKMSASRTGSRNWRSKKVAQLTLDDILIKSYDSGCIAAKVTNISQAHINQCCRGERKTAGGFKWMYLDDYEKMLEEQLILS